MLPIFEFAIEADSKKVWPFILRRTVAEHNKSAFLVAALHVELDFVPGEPRIARCRKTLLINNRNMHLFEMDNDICGADRRQRREHRHGRCASSLVGHNQKYRKANTQTEQRSHAADQEAFLRTSQRSFE